MIMTGSDLPFRHLLDAEGGREDVPDLIEVT